jgi:pimeloyl-ACP methyl ester carboxylesterase
MSKIHVNGINMHYWQVGQGDNVIMLHGLGGNMAVWHLKLLPLLRRDFCVTTYDLRGHGRTDVSPSGYTTGDLARDLRGLMDALGIERASLVGHSLGADIALHFGLLFPERTSKIVVIEAGLPVLIKMYREGDWSGWSYWAEVLERFTGVKVPPERRTDVDYLLDLSLNVPIQFGPAKGQPRKRDALMRLLRTTTAVQDYADVGEMTVENLSAITPKTLLMYEAESPYLRSYDVLRNALPNCSSALLPESNFKHFSPLEQADLIAAHVKSFLQTSPTRVALAMHDENELPVFTRA